mmetsp:Transcript_1324/g.3168  ORF Transcript_1324/g.3168 Transcript_1324/m.3168 type:complete len:209 (-) Transcript_1324:2148-2774(-)
MFGDFLHILLDACQLTLEDSHVLLLVGGQGAAVLLLEVMQLCRHYLEFCGHGPQLIRVHAFEALTQLADADLKLLASIREHNGLLAAPSILLLDALLAFQDGLGQEIGQACLVLVHPDQIAGENPHLVEKQLFPRLLFPLRGCGGRRPLRRLQRLQARVHVIQRVVFGLLHRVGTGAERVHPVILVWVLRVLQVELAQHFVDLVRQLV